MKALRTLLTLTLAALFAMPLLAANDAKDQNKKKPKAERTLSVVRLPKGLDLTAEQNDKLAEINKQYGPKFAEAQKKLAGILTDEQKQARAEVAKANRKAKKSGKEARAALDAALKLTGEQKKQFREAQQAVRAIRREAREKFTAVLTPEQRKQLPGQRRATDKKKKADKARPNKKKTDKKKTDTADG